MKKVTYLSDIKILTSVFASNSELLIIFDPSKMVQQDIECDFLVFYQEGELDFFLDSYPNKVITLFNCSKNTLDSVQNRIDFLFHFNKKKDGTNTSSFYFINNADGRIRWITPINNPSPSFLNLYNSSGIKAQAYKAAIKLAYKLKQQKWCCSGRFNLQTKKALAIDLQLREVDAEYYSIFTGTNGPNRKAIIELNKEGKTSHFIKSPLTAKAKQLISNEHLFLKRIEGIQLKKVVVPTVKRFENNIRLSSVQTNQVSKTTSLERQHLSALYELYNRSVDTVRVNELSILEEVNLNIEQCKTTRIRNGLSNERVQTICNLLERIALTIPKHKEISIGITHGDFTPWNMYVTNDKLHLYDWEMANEKCPLLFDAFHFIFQSEILINRSDFSKIKEKLLALEKMPTCQAIIQDFQIDFNLAYQLYLLQTVSYYLNLYTQQQRLHQQAYWLIDTWAVALDDALENEGLNRPINTSKMKKVS